MNKDAITNILITSVSKNNRQEVDIKRIRSTQKVKDKIFTYKITIDDIIAYEGKLEYKGSDEQLSKILSVLSTQLGKLEK